MKRPLPSIVILALAASTLASCGNKQDLGLRIEGVWQLTEVSGNQWAPQSFYYWFSGGTIMMGTGQSGPFNVGSASYSVNGNQITITGTRSAIGLTDSTYEVHFSETGMSWGIPAVWPLPGYDDMYVFKK